MSQFTPGQSLAALTASGGTRESTTITMPAVGAATQGDYVIMYNAAGVSAAAFIDIDSNGTAPSGALYVGSGSQATLAYKNAVQETYVVTFPATAGATQADYFVIYDEAGNSTAVWLDIDANGTAPTGALYVAAGTKIEVDIATGNSATQVGTAAFTAMNGSVTDVSFVDGVDGTVTVTLDNAAPASSASVPKDENDAGAGSIAVGAITAGVLATTAIAGGTLLSAVTLTDTTLTDNGDATVTLAASDIGDSTDAVPKDENDAGAGSVSVVVVDGSAQSFPYQSPSGSPSDLSVNPSVIS